MSQNKTPELPVQYTTPMTEKINTIELYANIIWPMTGFGKGSTELLLLQLTPPLFLSLLLLQSTYCRQIWVRNKNICYSKDTVKVTCWQLRDNQWNDEWPCLPVKVGRRCYSMNGNLTSEFSVISNLRETDSPNYGRSSNEWPWDAAETSVPVHTHK